MNKRKLGTDKERLAGKLLEMNGYKILEYNYRCKMGEIDIIAEEDGTIVFVEVKYRSSERCGLPEEAVHFHKQQKIIKVARWYNMEHDLYEKPCRFDVVSILGNQYKIHKAAFEV